MLKFQKSAPMSNIISNQVRKKSKKNRGSLLYNKRGKEDHAYNHGCD